MSADRLAGVFGSLLVRRFTVRQPEMYRIVEAVASQKLSTDKAAMCELAQTVMDTEFDGLDGDFIQAGAALGASIIIMAHAKRRNRPLFVHDPFKNNVNARTHLERVLEAQGVGDHLSVHMVPGAFEETLSGNSPVAICHLDCGDYDGTRVILERLSPRMVSGGHLIIDDYKTKSECRRAVDEYFRGRGGFKLIQKSRLNIVRL